MKLTVPFGNVLRIAAWVGVIALVSGLALGGAVGGPPSPRPSASATTSGCS